MFDGFRSMPSSWLIPAPMPDIDRKTPLTPIDWVPILLSVLMVIATLFALYPWV